MPRPIDAPRSGFGAILTLCLLDELRSRKRQGSGLGLTLDALLKDIESQSEVSARHVNRLRTQEQFPSPDLLEQLAKPLPALRDLAQQAITLRASWGVVERHQLNLQKGSTITILSWHLPKALMSSEESRQFAVRIVENILQGEMQYAFLYPPVQERQGMTDRIKEAVALGALSEFMKHAARDAIDSSTQNMHPTEFQPILAQLKDNIYVDVTTNNDTSLELWSRMPPYTVLYNLFAETQTYSLYGMFWERGLSPFAEPQLEFNVPVEGWTYLHPDDYKNFHSMLRETDPKKAIIKDHTRFPRPRMDHAVARE